MNYNRYQTGDYFTNYTTMGLEDLLSSGSLRGPLSTIKTDGQASDPVPVLSCVLLGSVLGPVLFLISINDLPDNIRSHGDWVLLMHRKGVSLKTLSKGFIPDKLGELS